MKRKSAIAKATDELADKNLTVKFVSNKNIKEAVYNLFVIPTNEIWIDKTLSKSEQRLLIAMESEHFWLMKNKTYKNAHSVKH